MSTPKVSISVPLYNKEKYIGRTISSLLSQTFSDFELIICDNASSDKSLEIVSSFNDPRIKIFTEKETNWDGSNWNKCVTLSSGKYVALFHADDLYDPQIIEKQVKAFEKYPELGAVFTRAYTIDEKDAVMGEMFADEALIKSETVNLDAALRSYIETGRGSFICPSATILKSVYDNIGLYRLPEGIYKFGNDYDLYFRVLEKYPIKILPEKLVKYRIYPEQDTNRCVKKNLEPNVFFHIVRKFKDSPALKKPLDEHLIKMTLDSEKKDMYICAFNAIDKKNYQYAKELLIEASRIRSGIYDLLINMLLSRDKMSLISWLIRLKYRSA